MSLPKNREERCALFNKRFPMLSELVADRVLNMVDNVDANRSMDRLVDYFTQHQDLHPEHMLNIANQHRMALSFSDSVRLGRLMEEMDSSLSHDDRAILAQWRDHPAFYLLFSIVEQRSGSTFIIRDLFTDHQYLIDSSALAYLQMKAETRGKHYLTLVYDTGLCLQTISLLHYAELSKEELRFLFTVIDAKRFESSGVDGVLKANPQGLSIFRQVSTQYRFTINGEELRAQFAEIELADYRFEEPYWLTEKKGRMRRYTLVEPSQAMYNLVDEQSLDIYASRQSITVFVLGKRTILFAYSTRAFDLAVRLLGIDEPVVTTLNMVLLKVVETERLHTPWFPFSFINAALDEPTEPDEQSEYSELVNRYIAASNYDEPFDLAYEARRLGIDLADAQRFIDQFHEHIQKPWAVPEEERCYEIEGCPLPAPAYRLDFGDSPHVIKHFDFAFDNDDVIDQLSQVVGEKFSDIEDLADLLWRLEDLFIIAIGDNGLGTYALNMLLWITLKAEIDKPLLVRSLALEIYRSGYTISEAMAYDQFVEKLSSVILSAMVGMHLYSLQERVKRENKSKGLYTIKATSALRALIKPKSVGKIRQIKDVRVMG